ncbi:MAG: HEAT repeat domain-containing protein, partial [Verrucomicrobia bacterium]|nr:HEAT repeat domain-containing protein [Verrucomicrobiota bacterium]
ERRVLFTGFGTGNPQLRVNGLFWGLDGWVYGANGRSDGEIRPGNRPDAAPIPLRGRDFRFRPDTLEFETLAGRSQFGHTRDDWGNRFLSWNTIPLRHEVIPDAFLGRNADTAAADALQDCLPPGDPGEVFPLTPGPRVFNNESGRHFNALSGLQIFRGHALGGAYPGNAFVGESLRNLVHRRTLVPEGPTFRADRTEQGREFLASSDPWFHPVAFATGPDGALYVADFYRRFVEHPDWVAREMRDRVPWSEGRDLGRLWRIRSRTQPQAMASGDAFTNGAPAERLVAALEDPNGWRRDTAHRRILEQQRTDTVPLLLRAVTQSKVPATRVAALHLLGALGRDTTDLLGAAASDPVPQVRAAVAQRLGAQLSRGQTPELQSLLIALSGDPEPVVRLQTALALGSVEDSTIREPRLRQLFSEATHRWIRLAAASSSRSPTLARELQPTPVLPQAAPVPRPPASDRSAVLTRMQPALELSGDPRQGAILASRLCLSCHYLQGHGQRVGPDLSNAGTRTPELLLGDILDPNRQVAPDYAAQEVEMVSGELLTGLIASETATRLTLRRPGGPDVNLARDQVRQIRATGLSLMPEGLEEGLTPRELAHLLAFLRAPDAALLPP